MTADAGRPVVLAVGSFPPPVQGAALVTERVVDRLGPDVEVVRVDVEPGDGSWRGPRKALRYLGALAVVARHRRACPSLYLAASGGEAILADALVLAVGRVVGCRAVVHHHSTRYLRAWSPTMAVLCRVAGRRATHVVLCESMAAALRRRYPPVEEVLVVDNAGLVVDGAPGPPPEAGAPLRLGHLSNLSREKGIDDVIDLALLLTERGQPVTLELAGPADEGAEAELDRAAGALGDAVRAPGLLDEADKAAFLARIDLFVFPSRYRHEAQPLVVYEALARGVPVVATDLGCLPDQLAGGAGAVVDRTLPFAPAAAAEVPRLLEAGARSAAHGRFAEARAASERQLGALCELLAGAGSRG